STPAPHPTRGGRCGGAPPDGVSTHSTSGQAAHTDLTTTSTRRTSDHHHPSLAPHRPPLVAANHLAVAAAHRTAPPRPHRRAAPTAQHRPHPRRLPGVWQVSGA